MHTGIDKRFDFNTTEIISDITNMEMEVVIGVIDDELNEADLEDFVVILEIVDQIGGFLGTNPIDLQRAITVCRIRDNDRKL